MNYKYSKIKEALNSANNSQEKLDNYQGTKSHVYSKKKSDKNIFTK